jgi:hypothetical protein
MVAKTVQRAEKRKRLISRKTTDTIVTSMVLPRSLHERATISAYRLNWSMAQLVRDAVEEWLTRHAKDLHRKARRG